MHLRRALASWRHLPLALNLGDSLDSTCTKVDRSGAVRKHALRTLERAWREEWRGTAHHLIGNNDFENIDRVQFRDSFLFSKTRALSGRQEKELVPNPGGDLNSYYSFSPVKGVRFVILDTMDVAASGWPKDTQNYREGWKLLTKHNHNKNLNSDAGLPDSIR